MIPKYCSKPVALMPLMAAVMILLCRPKCNSETLASASQSSKSPLMLNAWRVIWNFVMYLFNICTHNVSSVYLQPWGWYSTGDNPSEFLAVGCECLVMFQVTPHAECMWGDLKHHETLANICENNGTQVAVHLQPPGWCCTGENRSEFLAVSCEFWGDSNIVQGLGEWYCFTYSQELVVICWHFGAWNNIGSWTHASNSHFDCIFLQWNISIMIWLWVL